ncbi:MAG: lasso peptide biosynthesis protein [Prevotella sp.]|nr:lasso peptide biosynthesis protein [Prevotella sp.]
MRGRESKRNFSANVLLCAVCLTCALLFSSCESGGDVSSSSAGAPYETVTVSAETELSSPAEEISAAESSVSAESAEETSGESFSETSGTETSETVLSETETAAESEETTTDTAAPSDTEVSENVPETSGTASQTASETVSVSETTTVPTTAEPPKPAEIVILDVKVPLASGTAVFSEEKAELDYSNAADGYISVVYSGSSAQAKLRIANGTVQYDHDISVGGKRDFIPLMGSGSYSVKVYEHISGKNFAPVLSGEFEVSLKNETDTFLYPNKYVSFGQSSECVKKAAEVCAGKNGDVEEIAAIFGYVADSISYDKQLAATVQSGYIPDPDKTLAAGKGICFDYASLFAAMCRSRGIPARLVIGYADPNIYHAWNEVYTDETGWITPELFLKKKGYNIADATFYSSNSDKEKIADYISDDGNYAAVYRY